MFKGAKKDDLRHIALELNVRILDEHSMSDIIDLIKNSEKFKKDPESVKEIASLIIEERKSKDVSEVEIEKLKIERMKIELELARVRAETKDMSCEGDTHDSLDSLIKSIRTLTVKLPSKPENWGFFFSSLERAFVSKKVPEKFKAEILLNLLGEKASNVIIYLKDDLNDYSKIKEIVLRQYQPTPIACLDNFRKSTRSHNETYVQFASRLSTNYEYYLKLREVEDFNSLKELIVSDRLYETLDKETASHINVRQGDGWFRPNQMSKEIDLYFTSRGKSQPENYNSHYKNSSSKNASKVFFSDVKKCNICAECHNISSCPSFLKLSVNERIDVVKANKLCFNCLNFHLVSNCKAKPSCFCKKKHHASLHFSKPDILPQIHPTTPQLASPHETNKKENSTVSPDHPSGPGGNGNTFFQTQEGSFLNANAPEFGSRGLTFMSHKKQNRALLSTAVCVVIDEMGKEFKCRCLLDGGSQLNFLSRNFAERMQLKKEKTNVIVSGLNDASITIRSRVNAKIANNDKSFTRNLNFLIVPKITAGLTPSSKIDVKSSNFTNIKLADDKFNIPQTVDMILGVQVFYELLKPEQIRIENENIILQNTVFGFVVSGCASTDGNRFQCNLIKEEINLDRTLKQFWEVENVDAVIPLNKESSICEEHYKNNYLRDKTGRYVVKMPLKEDPACLGQSRDIALRKLNSLWSRLLKEPELSLLYSKFMHEYRELGHMVEVKENKREEGSYYIPHLSVYRPQNVSSPLRVVFNASSLTSKGNSLNSIQYNGGVIQEDLFSIMLRFRKFIYAFTADIKKMYRMISIHPEQRKLQRILWKEAIDDRVKTYELTTLTYGTASAPFLAMRTLKQLAADERENFPLASAVLESDVYMDDILTGSEFLDTAKELQSELVELLKRAGMSLHKWCSNNSDLLVSDDETFPFSKPEETKALGVVWKSKKDCFGFQVESINASDVTKREVLSAIARVFDPLGLLGPVITKAKIFMQKLWLLNLDWNDKLPTVEAEEWRQFSSAFQSINKIEIPRCVLIPQANLIELHGFADASEAAYGAVIYCKCRSESGEITISLVASKSRVSPIKQLTIPKLELCASVLLAKLINRVMSALKIAVNNVYLWTDSMIVLCWLQKEPCHLKTFVANRVAKIQELTAVHQWGHVASGENPADLISRGVDPDKLLQRSLWWSGPEFLIDDKYPEREIPAAVIQSDFSNELKNFPLSNSNCFSLSTDNAHAFINNLLNLSNNYVKIIRVLSYIFRFIENCKEKREKKRGPLQSLELKNAETFLLKQIQREEFCKEVSSLEKKGEISQDSQLRSLHPFLDSDGLLRVGGRLSESNLSVDKKFPILLPSKNKITRLILLYYHQTYLHLGPQSLLFHVRQKYWPLSGRNMCRDVVHKCVTCFKSKPRVCEQIMGSLPKERVTVNYSFNVSGVDFSGPYFIKYKNQRKGIYQKIYVSIFVCFVSRAVHFELVTELSSQAFIATLKRFFARRGKCSKLYSDNATNFVGSNQELKKLQNLVKNPDNNLSGYLSNEGVDWQFLPPRAPNFGGLWEAGVKSFKHHLKRVAGNSKLTYEEFLTLTVQIEGVLNSRPLVPLSADIDDLKALTPGHFLIGRPINSIVEPDLTGFPDNRLKSWQRISKMTQIIWKRWSSDYLSNLQQRSKWYFEKNNVKIGDLVIVKEDNMAVYNWPLGRILEVFPGKDNKIRVVKVKTLRGLFKRPITKICVLPMEE